MDPKALFRYFVYLMGVPLIGLWMKLYGHTLTSDVTLYAESVYTYKSFIVVAILVLVAGAVAWIASRPKTPHAH